MHQARALMAIGVVLVGCGSGTSTPSGSGDGDVVSPDGGSISTAISGSSGSSSSGASGSGSSGSVASTSGSSGSGSSVASTSGSSGSGSSVASTSGSSGSGSSVASTSGSSNSGSDAGACTAGLACTPTGLCLVGVTACSSGVQSCVATTAVASNGTVCDSGKFCDNGFCISCVEGASCAPANLCDVGIESCASGMACIDTGTALPPGTRCNEGEVCNSGGTCTPCAADGGVCTPTNPCHVGATSCAPGELGCSDTGTAVANGTACATNKVCDDGNCVVCVTGAPCTPANVCDVGTTDCATGTPVCVDTNTAVTNGTSCGLKQVCENGSCLSGGGSPPVATIVINPYTYNFASTPIGSSSATQAFAVTNLGQANSGALSTFTLSDSTDYVLSFGNNAGDCSTSTTLTGSGGTCNVYVTFTPWTYGTPTTTLTVTDANLNTGASGNLQGSSTYQVNESVLYNFSGPDGSGPLGTPIAATSGGILTLYGVTAGGGSTAGVCSGGGCGTVFALTPSQSGQTPWTETLPTEFLHSNGSTPAAGLFSQEVSGQLVLFGTTLYGATGSSSTYNTGDGTVFSLAGSTLTTLYDFAGGLNGANSSSTLITDDAAGVPGALYGTTRNGGDANRGMVFQLGAGPSPSFSTIWEFDDLHPGTSDGREPIGGLVADSIGNLYGMTFKFGTGTAGIVYELSPPAVAGGAWNEQVLLNFSAQSGAGEQPQQSDPLLMDPSGALYGTATTGGAKTNGICSIGCGVVFKLVPPAVAGGGWTEQILWNFTGAADGAFPMAGLIMDKLGNLYGTTNGGGNPNCLGTSTAGFYPGCGVAYKLTPPAASGGSWNLTTLWAFAGPPFDGANPQGGLVVDPSGTLYGTTQLGTGSAANPCAGDSVTPGCGTVFELTGTGFVTDGGI
jgi:uncharacterized repeat protein (TIGR03803 family)